MSLVVFSNWLVSVYLGAFHGFFSLLLSVYFGTSNLCLVIDSQLKKWH